MDKKKEQGVLGETFDAALKAVTDGAGQQQDGEKAEEGHEQDGEETKGEGAIASVTMQASSIEKNETASAIDLNGSLRHVWFDFHHEVQ